uniref:Uncharacterized protein n=1 Tax=Rhizophora mucronata TaxID=61149 RepID=A0A2P2M0L3_RHIMU
MAECRPQIFKSTTSQNPNRNLNRNTAQQLDDELNSSDDDGLPPLEANMNRMKPLELQMDEESDSGSDADS